MEQRKVQIKRQRDTLKAQTVRELALLDEAEKRIALLKFAHATEIGDLKRQLAEAEQEAREAVSYANLKAKEVDALGLEIDTSDKESLKEMRRIAETLCEYEWFLGDQYPDYEPFPYEPWMVREVLHQWAKSHDIFEFREYMRNKLRKEDE